MDVQDFSGPQVSITRNPIPLELLQNTVACALRQLAEPYLALGFGVWGNTSVDFGAVFTRSDRVRVWVVELG